VGRRIHAVASRGPYRRGGAARSRRRHGGPLRARRGCRWDSSFSGTLRPRSDGSRVHLPLGARHAGGCSSRGPLFGQRDALPAESSRRQRPSGGPESGGCDGRGSLRHGGPAGCDPRVRRPGRSRPAGPCRLSLVGEHGGGGRTAASGRPTGQSLPTVVRG